MPGSHGVTAWEKRRSIRRSPPLRQSRSHEGQSRSATSRKRRACSEPEERLFRTSVSNQLEVHRQFVHHFHRFSILDHRTEPPLPDRIDRGLVEHRLFRVIDDLYVDHPAVLANYVPHYDLIFKLLLPRLIRIDRIILRDRQKRKLLVALDVHATVLGEGNAAADVVKLSA